MLLYTHFSVTLSDFGHWMYDDNRQRSIYLSAPRLDNRNKFIIFSSKGNQVSGEMHLAKNFVAETSERRAPIWETAERRRFHGKIIQNQELQGKSLSHGSRRAK